MAQQEDRLQRTISGFNAYTLVVGSIIGTGIFYKPQAIFEATGTASLGLLCWVIGCLLSLCGGLIIAEIGVLIPETGGLMTYLEKIYNPLMGYIVGWAQLICFYPIRIAAAGVIFGTQAVALLKLSDQWIIPLALASTLLISLIQSLGNAATDWLQNVSMLLKTLPIIGIIVYGLFFNPDPVTIRFLPVTMASHPLMGALSIGVIATLYATDGWMNVTNISGEMKDPDKNIPRSLVYGIGTVTVIYLAINLAYLRVMLPEQLAQSLTPATDVAGLLFGPLGSKLITIGIMVSIFGSQAAYSRAAWRIPYAMGLRNLLPGSRWLRAVHDWSGMPINSGIVITVITIGCIIFIRDYNALTDIGSFLIWSFYILAFVGIFILRRIWPDRERPYRCPLYPWIPILGIVGALVVVLSTLYYQPLVALWAIGLTLLGLPVYYYQVKQS